MAAVPAEFARWADPAGEKLLMVLVDDAGWYVAPRPAVPPNVVLHRRPPCTPERPPAEPLWPLVREAVASRGFGDLGTLQKPLSKRCRWPMCHPEVVRRAVGFHWAVALNDQ